MSQQRVRPRIKRTVILHGMHILFKVIYWFLGRTEAQPPDSQRLSLPLIPDTDS